MILFFLLPHGELAFCDYFEIFPVGMIGTVHLRFAFLVCCLCRGCKCDEACWYFWIMLTAYFAFPQFPTIKLLHFCKFCISGM